MATFTYEILTREGKKKKGSIEADSYQTAKGMIRGDGVTIIALQTASVLNKNIELQLMKKKIKSRDIAIFCRQFNSILRAGVSVIVALEMLSQQSANKLLSAALMNVRANVEKGDTLANAMRKEEGIFPALLLNMIDAGEQSGSLEKSLSRMAQHFDKEQKIKGMVQKAMIYPCVLLMVALGVLVVMLVFIIPTFVKTFQDANIEMPAFTMAVVHTSDFVIDKWYLLIGIIAAVLVVIKVIGGTKEGKRFYAAVALRVPFLGDLITKTACGRFSRNMSTLIASGMSMIDALGITKRTLSNVLYQDALDDAAEQVTKGQVLSQPLRVSGLFPPMVVHMVGIGEETGNMEEMLDNIADYYDDEVELATQSLTALMEPAIIIVMAFIVCLMILAIFEPMMALYNIT